MAGGMDTGPGAAPSPPLLCLRLGGRAVTTAAAAAAVAVILLSSRGIIKSPLFSATGPRSAAFRRWQADAAAASAAVVVVIVVAQDLQVVARRCDGSSIRRHPSFSRDGNDGGGGGGGGGGQEGLIRICNPDPGAGTGVTIAVVSSPPLPAVVFVLSS